MRCAQHHLEPVPHGAAADHETASLSRRVGLQRVVLPKLGKTRYRLREEHHEDGLATYEAIARALGILEGLELQTALEGLFEAMVEATLATRGRGTGLIG